MTLFGILGLFSDFLGFFCIGFCDFFVLLGLLGDFEAFLGFWTFLVFWDFSRTFEIWRGFFLGFLDFFGGILGLFLVF